MLNCSDDVERISVGLKDFSRIVMDDSFFVDKTEIAEILKIDGPVLIAKPRRWGKSMNLDTLKQFLTNNEKYAPPKKHCHANALNKSENKEDNLFYGLKVCDLKGIDASGKEYHIVEKYQGKYPVIHISLQALYAPNIDDFKKNLAIKMGSVFEYFKEHTDLYEYLEGRDDTTNLALAKKALSWARNAEDAKLADEADVTQTISKLSRILHAKHGNRVYILIDEYDDIANDVFNHYIKKGDLDVEYFNEVVRIFTRIFSTIGKEQDGDVQKIILTGISNAFAKDISSTLNNLRTYSMLKDTYSDFYGFRKEEIEEQLIAKLGLSEFSDSIMEKLEQHYNGYMIYDSQGKSVAAYNPWSVMNYLQDICVEGNIIQNPESYWGATGGTERFQELLKKISSTDFADKLADLILGKEVELPFNENKTLSGYITNFADSSQPFIEEIIVYILFYEGYLTARKEVRYDFNGDPEDRYFFTIPNGEVLQEFRKAIKDIKGSELYNSYYKVLNLGFLIQGILQSSHELVQEKLNILEVDKNLASYDGMNFNLLHIAAMSDDPATMLTLLQDYLSDDTFKAAIAEGDKLHNMTPIDYLYLFRKNDDSAFAPNEIIYNLGIDDSTSPLIDSIVGDRWHDVKCLAIEQTDNIAGSIAALIGAAGGTMARFLPGIGGRIAGGIGGLGGGGISGGIVKSIVKKITPIKHCVTLDEIEDNAMIKDLKKDFFDNDIKYLHLESCEQKSHQQIDNSAIQIKLFDKSHEDYSVLAKVYGAAGGAAEEDLELVACSSVSLQLDIIHDDL